MTSTTSRLIAATDSSSQAGKTLRKALLIGVMLVTVFLVAGISMTIGWRPIIGAKTRALTTRNFERTPQRLERGRYIFMGLSGCVHCHSPLEGSQRGFPPVMSLMGSGQVLVEKASLGRIVAPNLTPDTQTGSGAWTDDQLARAIREGIGHDGRTLFPMMPYENFRSMSDEDLASVVVFLRSLPPIRHELPKTTVAFPVKYLIKGLPQPVTSPVRSPVASDRVQWGKYLVRLANCADCHTARGAHGEPLPGMDFAGGQTIAMEGVMSTSANLTPDASGIPYYDEALFIRTLRTGTVGARELSSIMPFVVFRNLSDDDLKAIFAYLQTLKPVRHRVDNSLPPTYCRLCRHKHGAGDQN
jgi:mono/diheme cytochrome c family protein